VRSKFGGMILLMALAGVLLLASCSTPSSPGTSSTSSVITKPFGSLVVAPNVLSAVMMDTTGKGVTVGIGFNVMVASVVDSLLQLDLAGQPSPMVAERWEIAKDGLSQTFYLRKGIKFHNGDDLTAADVKFTIDTMMAEAAHTYAAAWKSLISKVEIKDDYTVVIYTKLPAFELLPGLATERGEGAVLPKKYIEEKGWDYFAKNIVGSGPWKVLNFQIGTRLDLEANENYWGEVAKFKSVSFVSIREEATKVAMLKTGELDVAEVSPDSVPGLKTAGLRIVGHYGASQNYAALFYDLDNPQKLPFGDVRVRKAMSLAIDRKEVADKLYRGYAQPSALFYIPKTAYHFDPALIKPDPLDADQAKKLLAEAGYANGFKTTIWDSGGGGIMTLVNQALSGYWSKIGITAEATPRDYTSVLKMFNPKHTPEIWGTIMGYTTAGSVYQFESTSTGYHTTKGAFKNANNPKLNDLIDKVPQTADPVEKKKLAVEAAVLAKNEYSILPVVDVDTIYAIGSKVGELKPVQGSTSLATTLELISHPK
ncbi:MAG: ABC transporter substrate-binding protein, partial [Dehalococcoidia bacterium]|nr:ABC transporter substrate-binding protein [Dehalococcoidia bacterium]